MISTKKHIQQLAAILVEKGVNDILISPGSRNGPLIHTFVGCGKFNCRNIVDERSAGYFAIGLSQAVQKPVVLVCSSGTAALNYAPAVAEAFYLNISLIVITADRPEYWINQGESQCVPQKNIYQNFVKKEFSLPLNETEKELWYAARIINETINSAVSGTAGPVHINVPLEEPLHDLVETNLPEIKGIENTETYQLLTEKETDKLALVFNQYEKVLILAGQQEPDNKLEDLLNSLTEKTGAVILNEHLSNLNNTNFCGSVDIIMASILTDKIESFQPDLLISFGGQFVSKSLKQFLRKNSPAKHWHLSLSNEHFDTYQALSKVIPCYAFNFFSQLQEKIPVKQNSYLELWKDKERYVNNIRNQYIKQADFSDLTVFDRIRNHVPQDSIVHLGNSTPVRYALICEATKKVQYLSNRGTSGIDGCVSSAVGFASNSEKMNTVIVGDLSFFYDSNALWNKYIKNNLRIIVINNGGGNIFGLIKGPSDSPAFEKHFFTESEHKAEGIAKAFQLDYLKAENDSELELALKLFYSKKQTKPALLEVFTNAETNTETFRSLFKQVKN